MKDTIALRTRELTKSFSGTPVVFNVNFELKVGARQALIGPNGAGKTTLINLLTGNLVPSKGSVWINDRDVTQLPSHRRVKAGLARTFQINQLLRELSVIEHVQLAVAERLGFGSIMLGGRRVRRETAEQAYDILESLKLDEAAVSPIARLSYGRQRLVEVAIALALQPTVLLLDEPAAGVPPADLHAMFELIERLPPNVSVLFIEHDMKLVARFAQRISVLVAGQIVVEGTPQDIASNSFVRDIYLGIATMFEAGKSKDIPSLVCERVSAGWGATQVITDISFELPAGEILAVLGRNGVGKTTLLSTIAGRADLKSGEIKFAEASIGALPAYSRASRGIGLVPQEREIFPSLSVEENLLVAACPRDADANEWTLSKVFHLFPQLKERRGIGGTKLSGGEQQMLAIGRALMGNPSVLLMDEPMEGLAPVIVDLIVSALKRIRTESGVTILLVEQHLDIALEFTNRLLVLDRGSIIFDAADGRHEIDRAFVEGLIGVDIMA